MFSFPLKSGGGELKPAPIVYLPNLMKKICDLLDKKLQVNHDFNTLFFFFYHTLSFNKLVWHDGKIPLNEIWVKLGGDKGGTSFKMNFQILNVNYPNAVNNTWFCAFLAPDSYFNLHVALTR